MLQSTMQMMLLTVSYNLIYYENPIKTVINEVYNDIRYCSDDINSSTHRYIINLSEHI